MELYPHQIDAVRNLHNGSILWGGVGTGKSMAAVDYYIKNEAPKDVYVITTAKKRNDLDWDGEFVLYGVGKAKDATVAGVLTVDSWNQIGNYTKIENAFFIFDEQRLVGSGAWVKAFIKIAKSNNWIMLSATPGDVWLDYCPVFIANGFYKNKTEFVREHVIFKPFSKFPKIERYVGVGKLVRQRNSILVEMPYLKHTVRHLETVTVDFDKDIFERVLKKRWHVYENRPLRNVAELFYVMRKVVNSDASRLQEIRGLMEKHSKLIVFYNFDYELEILRTLSNEETTSKCGELLPDTKSEIRSTNQKTLPSFTKVSRDGKSIGEKQTHPIEIAELNGHKHDPLPTTDSWVYLVQYVAGAEGWNCVDTDAVAFYSLTYSYKNWHQAHGRIDRLNTKFTDLYYYALRSNSVIDQAVWKSLESKQNFNESGFIKKI